MGVIGKERENGKEKTNRKHFQLLTQEKDGKDKKRVERRENHKHKRLG